MTEREKLESYTHERMSYYISFMFNEAGESIQDQIFALLEDDIGVERGEELWRQSGAAVDMLWDMDERLAELDNKNKE